MTESQPAPETTNVAKQDRRPSGPELRRTQTIAGAALLLTVLAAVSAPRNPEPSDFVDLGERFFPNFEDPEEARSLEVIEFDQATAEAIPFRVQNENGIWTIPSHHDYPADGQDRLAQTAAGIMLLEKTTSAPRTSPTIPRSGWWIRWTRAPFRWSGAAGGSP